MLPEHKGYIFYEWHYYKGTPPNVWDFENDVVTEATIIRVYYKQKPVDAVKKVNIKKKTKAFILSWDPVDDCDGYNIEYATKKDFSNAKRKSVLAGKNPKEKKSLTISKLTKKKTYYVRIQAYRISETKLMQLGEYSPIKKVKITK